MDRVFGTPCILYNVLLISNLVCTNAVPSSNCTTLFVLMCVKTQYRNWNEIIIDKKILCSLNNLFLLPSSISAQWHQNVRVSLICGVRSIILMSIYKINNSIYPSCYLVYRKPNTAIPYIYNKMLQIYYIDDVLEPLCYFQY